MSRQGGTSNLHQPLTSNDVYLQMCMAINSSGCSHLFTFALMMIGAFSQSVCKLFSELKLATDNHLLRLAYIMYYNALMAHFLRCEKQGEGKRTWKC